MSDAVTLDDVLKIIHDSTAASDKIFAQRMLEIDKAMVRSEREWEKAMVRSEREWEKVTQNVNKVSQDIGRLGNKWGEFVENMVAPACNRLFSARNIPVHQIFQKVKSRLNDGRNMEVDILAVNADNAVLIEVKSTLTVENVQDHIERLQQFKLFFPQYASYRVLGAVAGMTIGGGVDSFARKQGLFVIAQSGGIVDLANEPNFEPSSW